MSKITVLHVSDLHWSEKGSDSIAIVTEALIEDVKRMKIEKNVNPDILIFSGDLVLAGEDSASFYSAFDAFIFPLAIAAGIPKHRIYVCSGNHDISREQVRSISMIERGLSDKLKSSESINDFIKKSSVTGGEEELALKRNDNFFKAHDSYFAHDTYRDRFQRIFKTDIGGQRIGVACLNSAWRATGEADDADYRHVVIGEACVDNALKEMEDCTLRIAVHHHPMDWLLPADQSATEARVRHGFDLTCYGHLHKAKPSYLRDPAGSCVMSQSGSVYAGRKWFNGYQLIEIDLLTWTYLFRIREYHDNRRAFDAATSVCDGGEFTLSGSEQKSYSKNNQVELFLREYRENLRSMAKDHFDFGNIPANCTDAMADYFVVPPLTKRVYDVVSDGENTFSTPSEIDLVDILAEDANVLFLGERQVGKSSLAFHIALEIASGHGPRPTIPVYMDAKSHKLDYQGIRRSITSFYGPMPKGFELEKAIGEGIFTFLLDNFVVYDENYLSNFKKHTDIFSNCRWICFGTPDRDSVSPNRIFNEYLPNFEKIHIKELPRKAIRALSKKWSDNGLDGEKALFESVMHQLVRDGLPRTPYMVSLLLWGINQKQNLARINEASLLGNVIDHLLGKADFRQSIRGTLNPIGKEITLQHLALYIYDQDGFSSENDVLEHLVTFFKQKKLPFVASDVLEKLVECGIIRRHDDVVSFKYPCFQEYFIASHFKAHPEKLSEKLVDLQFLSYRREIELLAGMRQQNDDVILALSVILENRVPEKFRECDINEFDKFASREIKVGTTRARLNEIRRNRLTNEQVDEMLDEADRRALQRGEKPVSSTLRQADGDVVEAARVHEGQAIEADRDSGQAPMRPATHMATIDLLARVLKNSDFTDYEKKGPATKKIFESWVAIFMMIQDELGYILRAIGEKSGENLSEDEVDTIKYIMGKLLFNGAGDALISQIASPTIVDTLVSLLDEGQLSKGEMLLVLFVFEDLNDGNWQERWSDVVADKNVSGFVLETFIDRMWSLAHSKALDDDQSKRLIGVVETIEQRLEWNNHQKNSMLQGIKDVTSMQKMKEAGRKL